MSAPTVPQRPSRSQNPASAEPAMPQVPPRPSRSLEKSKSPHREQSARSPLNDPAFRAPPPRGGTNGVYAEDSEAKRPSITSLPQIGHEGEEYTSLDQVPQLKNTGSETPSTPQDTRSVAGDLPLHAPKASSGSASSRSQVAPVVRTDTASAAEAGIGKVPEHLDPNHDLNLRPSSSRAREYRPQSSSGLSREITRELTGSRSASRGGGAIEDDEDDEHGIPHIGQHVPMYPNAGDVQAPSPAPWQGGVSTGVGFFNDSNRPSSSEGRRKSAAGWHGPAGSYGLHGHGMTPQDQFEKSWYQKHPEELKKEEHALHGPASALQRAEWNLSSDELNKLVRSSSQPGFGTSPNVTSVPTEMVGYTASAEYSSKVNSPSLSPTKSREQQTHVESPLRKATTPGGPSLEDDSVHLDPLPTKTDRYTGQGYAPPTMNLGPTGGNTDEKGGYIVERGTGTPILASDEVERNPATEYQQPAISPEALKHGDGEYFDDDSMLPAWQRRPGSAARSRSRPTSRPTSRPASTHFHHHDVHMTGTPLNEIQEYEPLFKDDEDQKERPTTAADKLKRPELEQHRFPSQDIWEDTPNSLQLHTTVETEQEPDIKSATANQSKSGASLFEHPDKEAARKGEVTESERLSFLDDPKSQKAKPKFNAGVQAEVTRPGMRHRFPSQDIWEDTPDSLRLETTVGPEETKLKSPTGGSVPAANNLAQGFAAADRSMAAKETGPVELQALSTKDQPTVPPRPSRQIKQESPTKREAPTVPERPKPQVPARPTRASHGSQSESSPVTSPTITSPTEESAMRPKPTDETATKSKPTVPSKPAGSSKFASIKSGFMNDLNSRLQLGPQARKAAPEPEPEKQVEEEKIPLSDARKGRARGPARRKPDASPGAAASTSTASASSTASWAISAPQPIWSISSAGLNVFSTSSASPAHKEPEMITTSSRVGTNTAGESVESVDAQVHAPSPSMDARARSEEASAAADVREAERNTRIGAEGDMPDPIPSGTESAAPILAPSATELKPTNGTDSAMQTGETTMKGGVAEEPNSRQEAVAYVDGGKEEGSTVIVTDDGKESTSAF